VNQTLNLNQNVIHVIQMPVSSGQGLPLQATPIQVVDSFYSGSPVIAMKVSLHSTICLQFDIIAISESSNYWYTSRNTHFKFSTTIISGTKKILRFTTVVILLKHVHQ